MLKPKPNKKSASNPGIIIAIVSIPMCLKPNRATKIKNAARLNNRFISAPRVTRIGKAMKGMFDCLIYPSATMNAIAPPSVQAIIKFQGNIPENRYGRNTRYVVLKLLKIQFL